MLGQAAAVLSHISTAEQVMNVVSENPIVVVPALAVLVRPDAAYQSELPKPQLAPATVWKVSKTVELAGLGVAVQCAPLESCAVKRIVSPLEVVSETDGAAPALLHVPALPGNGNAAEYPTTWTAISCVDVPVQLVPPVQPAVRTGTSPLNARAVIA